NQDRDRQMSLVGCDITNRKIEFCGVVVRNTAARGKQVRNGLFELSPTSQRGPGLQLFVRLWISVIAVFQLLSWRRRVLHGYRRLSPRHGLSVSNGTKDHQRRAHGTSEAEPASHLATTSHRNNLLRIFPR